MNSEENQEETAGDNKTTLGDNIDIMNWTRR